MTYVGMCRWNSVSKDVINTLHEQLEAHPGYSIATTGHSLGGEFLLIELVGMRFDVNEMQVLFRVSLRSH